MQRERGGREGKRKRIGREVWRERRGVGEEKEEKE